MSEYAPKRLLAVIVSMMFCGMPAGAVLATQVSAVMLPRWGWQSVFYAGGVLPLTLAILLIAILPESVRYLEVTGAPQQKLSNILARIGPELRSTPISRSGHQDQRTKAPVVNLFTEGRAAGTILLWIPYFMNLLMLYFVAAGREGDQGPHARQPRHLSPPARGERHPGPGHVHWARDAAEANAIVARPGRGGRRRHRGEGQVDGHPGDRAERGARGRGASAPSRPTWPSSSCSSATTGRAISWSPRRPRTWPQVWRSISPPVAWQQASPRSSLLGWSWLPISAWGRSEAST